MKKFDVRDDDEGMLIDSSLLSICLECNLSILSNDRAMMINNIMNERKLALSLLFKKEYLRISFLSRFVFYHILM